MNKDHEGARALEHLARSNAKREGAMEIKARHYSDGSEALPTKTSGWRAEKNFDPRGLKNTGSVSAWSRRGVFVISAHELAEAPDGTGEAIPQWHVSISTRGNGSVRRSTDAETRQALACFFVAGAEEDNHEPGIARHFWMPLDPKRRRDCECKADEATIVEPDGHRWTTPADGSTCNGCDYEAMMLRETGIARPCPIHKPGAADLSVLDVGRPFDRLIVDDREEP